MTDWLTDWLIDWWMDCLIAFDSPMKCSMNSAGLCVCKKWNGRSMMIPFSLQIKSGVNTVNNVQKNHKNVFAKIVLMSRTEDRPTVLSSLLTPSFYSYNHNHNSWPWPRSLIFKVRRLETSAVDRQTTAYGRTRPNLLPSSLTNGRWKCGSI